MVMTVGALSLLLCYNGRMIEAELIEKLRDFANTSKRLTVLTGAGISVESGLPTFRGPKGYWTVESKEYHSQEMATNAMFQRQPNEVWKWYLYRRGIYHAAQPNAGHTAIAELEERFGDRFTLITQNVDGLHLRAGNSPKRTYQIHGNIDYMRCARECSAAIYPIPTEISAKDKGEDLSVEEQQLLRCPKCGGRTRPHVLWFDEIYNEEHYRFESSLRAAAQTELLIVVGTSGATNLPNQVVARVVQRKGLIIDVNPEKNVFSQTALLTGGYFLQQPAGTALPELVKIIGE